MSNTGDDLMVKTINVLIKNILYLTKLLGFIPIFLMMFFEFSFPTTTYVKNIVKIITL
ncbi:hypothetical protein [Clostridium formicaceticum]|uniref:hypothetical protein n=1 Tax=Clostridium formicaceticum TaxID=1497 RepID=UPI00196B1BF2|nr:hypothetical protein [Clostridium formicaceticum]